MGLGEGTAHVESDVRVCVGTVSEWVFVWRWQTLCGGGKGQGKRLHGCSELGTNPLLALQSICRVHILTMA